MTASRVEVRKGTYHDSVTLMQVSREAESLPGVEAAAAVAATQVNLELLARQGFAVDTAGLGPNDLVLCVLAADEEAADQAMEQVEALLAGAGRLSTGGGSVPGGPGGLGAAAPRSLRAAARRDPGLNLAVLSVPGRHLHYEIAEALQAGLHVFCFSDGLDPVTEAACKRAAAERGLLLMGPDCGTAILDGVGLGFANAVRRGPVGIVGASGTGIQEVTCLLDAAGVGISHAIGVGGRDLSPEVGGIMTLRALDLLAADEGTERVVVISKPPDPQVARQVAEAAAATGKPSVLAFPGLDNPPEVPPGVSFAGSLEAAAAWAVEGVMGVGDQGAGDAATEGAPESQPPGPGAPEREGNPAAEAMAAVVHNPPPDPLDTPAPRAATGPLGSPAAPNAPAVTPGAIRGLFSGGTLCYEAMAVVAGVVGRVASNIPLRPEWRLADPNRSDGHTFVDFGDDAMTEGRAHPMIDPGLRNERFRREAADPETGVVLLDVVLGYGAHPDPAGELAPLVEQALADRPGGLSVVVSLCGAAGDPQGLDSQAATLRAAGALVTRSSAQAARLALAAAGLDRAGDQPAAGEGATVSGLLGQPLKVVNAGVELFAAELEGQQAEVARVEWRPPAAGVEAALERLAAHAGEIAAANDLAVAAMQAAEPRVVGIGRAGDLLPGLDERTLLHAGPPIDWAEMCGPLRGAIIGAAVYEGIAADPEEAVRLAERGGLRFGPCHERGVVGPMAGVVSASMPVWVVENGAAGNRAFCTLNEGLGKVLRYGAYDAQVLDRLAWMRDVLARVLTAALERLTEPLDLRALIAQALQMGDEGHNRNRAGTSLLLRTLLAALLTVEEPTADVVAAAEFISGNDHFFLNLAMAAGKATADAAAGTPGSSIVTAMARNGTEFGVRLAGTGDRWFTGPAGVVDGLYLPGFGPEDANRDIGDSTITETIGIGGMAMAAAPAIVRFVGGSPEDAIAATLAMYDITWAESSSYQVPTLGFRGTPLGIDAREVVHTGVLPTVNTGIAHKDPGVGQVGAGLVEPPMEAFVAATRALAGTF